MKTNGSMVHRQWHINNASRERQTPVASSPCSPPFSSVPLQPSHLFLLGSLFCLPAETDYFTCEACYLGLAGCSPVHRKGIVKWRLEKKQTKKVGKTPGQGATGVSLLAAMTSAFAVNLYYVFSPSCLPFSLCFISQFFLPFVIWKEPAGRTGFSVEQWSILIH